MDPILVVVVSRQCRAAWGLISTKLICTLGKRLQRLVSSLSQCLAAIITAGAEYPILTQHFLNHTNRQHHAKKSILFDQIYYN